MRHVRDPRRRPPRPRLPDAGDPRKAETLLLEPLAGLPVVRDLIVDTTPFWEAWRSVEPWFTPLAEGDARVLPAGDPSRDAIEAGLDCISCGACWTACDVAGAEHGFAAQQP